MKPALAPAESLILHELAAVLTSVHGFAEMLDRFPEHPEEQRFLSMVLSESRKAVVALRDLQLVRSLMAGDLHERLTSVDVGELAAGAGVADASRLQGVVVRADRDLLSDILVRCVTLSGGEVTTEDREAVRLIVPVAGENLVRDLESWRTPLRPIALAANILPRWGIGVEIEEARVLLTFPD